ncbi:MAG: acyl--CoA ligase [Solobacterium sp.]|nr:acyl--CoA ligase [Solobacterium sp.]
MEAHDYTGMPRRHLEYPELTMFQMVEKAAAQYPDEPAYEFYGRKVSYKDFCTRVVRTASGLYEAGIRKNDAVTICLPNVPQALDSFYALNHIGAAANMIHPLSAEEEITYYLDIAASRWIITLDMFYEKVRKAADAAKQDVTVICARIQDELPLHLKYIYILKAGRPYLKFPEDRDILFTDIIRKTGAAIPQNRFEKDHTAVILYSGGTSGKPKGVCLSDLNFNACAMQVREAIQMNFQPGLTMLSCMPMFHGFGLGINIHAVLAHGVCCILMPNFNIRSYSDMLIKRHPSFIAGVPTIFDALLHADKLKNADLSFLKGVFCGGDSLSVDLKQRVDSFLHERHADIQIREGYGLTECVTASCLTPRDIYRINSIGLPFPDTVYDIVKPGTTESAGVNEEGEIVLKGPSVMLGYLNNEEETKETLKRRDDGDVWLFSGDLGKIDEDGYVYFIRRLKRMIVTNGYNVYPDRIEEVINHCDCVDISCVIGLPDAKRGQRVTAFVVPEEGADKDDLRAKIMDALKRSTAAYAIPKDIIFKDDLPRTLVGKIAYRKLEEEYQ